MQARTVISTSKKFRGTNTVGARVRTAMVVYKTPAGKNKKGKTIYSSRTVHEAA
jgi:hypothetical protein